MIPQATIKAALRLSPKMIVYHLKRGFRNRFCLSCPSLYDRYLERVGRKVPRISKRPVENLSLAETVSKFYYHEYHDGIGDAARGVVTLFGQTVDFGSAGAIQWHHELEAEKDFHLWRMKLAHMGFVGPMLIDGDEDALKAVAEMIAGFRQYAVFNRPGCFSSYWFPYSVSHRILAIMSGYLIARAGGRLSAELDDTLAEFLRWNVAFVLANVEHELKNNHVERNLAAVCLYYNHVDTVPRALARRIDQGVREIITATILPDGMLAERSAMYQALSVMALHIFAASEFLSTATRALAASKLRKAEVAWALMTHPDGQIALFNDSWCGEVPEAGLLVKAPHFGSIEMLEHAGYARLATDDYFVLFDAGAIGPRWNPGHGHADFLAVEIDVIGERFVVDPGTFQYSTGARRAFERSARSHNGPVFAGCEPVEYHGCFKVGKMTAAHFGKPMGGGAVSVAGELELQPGSVRREVTLLADAVRCVDIWRGEASRGKVRVLVQGQWAPVTLDGGLVTFERGDLRASIAVTDGRIAGLEEAEWSRHYLSSEHASALVLEPAAVGPGAARLTWTISYECLGEDSVGPQAL